MVEIGKGSKVKYELDKESGLIKVRISIVPFFSFFPLNLKLTGHYIVESGHGNSVLATSKETLYSCKATRLVQRGTSTLTVFFGTNSYMLLAINLF